ncbi:MAG TPA: sigma-70 family RNA polymerase sigma factor [Steroidobacteraceae bacterium]|nr:sigma-70 family RNA polymerase sigma factor [Steroidobacteraceae bacterium]
MRDTDRELEGVLSTHAAALSRLAASYESRPALREELLQDIAFALWRALPAFRRESSEKTFVMRIATNRALSHIAARKGPDLKGTHPINSELMGCVPFKSDPVWQVVDPGPRPEEEVASMQGAARLQAAVRGLPLAQRQVMVLALEGLDHDEIARVLGISEGNVAVRLHRGKALLKAALGEKP